MPQCATEATWIVTAGSHGALKARTMMFFRLTDEQQEIQRLVRKFAQQEIAPQAERWDEEAHFPREILRPLAQLGRAGPLGPQEARRPALSPPTGAVIYEELGKADMSIGVWLSVHNMVAGLISKFGNDEQRGRWLPGLTSGELLGAFSLSEAHAGSDAANVRATAVREGGDYVLNGTKFWVSSAGVADVYSVMLRTNEKPSA